MDVVDFDFGPLRVEHRRPDGAVRVLAETPSWADAARAARAAIAALGRRGERGSVAIVAAATGEDVGEHALAAPAGGSDRHPEAS